MQHGGGQDHVVARLRQIGLAKITLPKFDRFNTAGQAPGCTDAFGCRPDRERDDRRASPVRQERRRRPRKERLERIFAERVLGWNLGPFDPDQAYALDHLKDATYQLAREPNETSCDNSPNDCSL
jgi:hypothetical protein